ncbi:hypothetical protein [Roseiconus lacunae]|uniref:hypothetical protein n=1 Tax=Roseiconus lacunae TaxID=2605694 RepID=UPI001E2988FC|nr:hypothetical protein [Roseiconus lacunae]MCD0462921.1 hypothetical protein [Roseiconus lacunae]
MTTINQFCRLSFSAICICGILTLSGCSGGSQAVSTETDEIEQYLEDHPELKEPKPEVDNSVLTGE